MTLTDALAEQLAWQRNRDEANEQDRQIAVGKVQQWNERRAAAGLRPLREDYDPVITGCIVISDDSDSADDESAEDQGDQE